MVQPPRLPVVERRIIELVSNLFTIIYIVCQFCPTFIVRACRRHVCSLFHFFNLAKKEDFKETVTG